LPENSSVKKSKNIHFQQMEMCFSGKKTACFPDTGTVEKAVIPGKIKKTCPRGNRMNIF
jgi:hypothetical protein